MSLYVVYATDTGHVVGALAVAGTPAATPAVAELVGDGLPLPVTPSDGTPIILPLASSQLAAAAVEDTGEALAWPMRYGVAVADGKPKSRLARLERWPPSHNPVKVEPGRVTVSLEQPATRPTPVLVVLRGRDGSPVPLSGEIPAGTASRTWPVSLTAGPYGVLALVAGWEGRLVADTVP